MKQYHDLISYILENGIEKEDRTGTGTLSIFSYDMNFDLREGFPLLTTKKMEINSIINELLWFISGDSNIKFLLDNNCHIWTPNAHANYLINNKDDITLNVKDFERKIQTDFEFCKLWGDLGPIYGNQWRRVNSKNYYPELSKYVYESFNKQIEYHYTDLFYAPHPWIDQLQNSINMLNNEPDSRRNIVNSWNVDLIDEMILPPCHYSFQLYTRKLSVQERTNLFKYKFPKQKKYSEEIFNQNNIPERSLSLKWIQRSVDVGLGLPFNVASYALLTHMIAQCANMIPERLIFSGGDCHIYKDHIESLKFQIKRKPYKLPILKLNESITNIDDFKFSDINIQNYKFHPKISMKMSA